MRSLVGFTGLVVGWAGADRRPLAGRVQRPKAPAQPIVGIGYHLPRGSQFVGRCSAVDASGQDPKASIGKARKSAVLARQCRSSNAKHWCSSHGKFIRQGTAVYSRQILRTVAGHAQGLIKDCPSRRASASKAAFGGFYQAPSRRRALVCAAR